MQSNAPEPDTPSPNDPPRVGRSEWARFALFMGVVAVLVVGVIAAIALFGNRLPELTEERLEEAVRRWEESGVRSYVLELEITGMRAGQVHLEVKNGVVVELERDGQSPRRRAAWEVWSVPGQFDMMQRGLEMAADPAGELQVEQGAEIVVRAKFHPELGYPLAFTQVTLGGGPEFGWKTVRFEPR